MRERARTLRPWLAPVGVLLAVLLALVAGGAPRAAPGNQGRLAAAEEEIVLARWVLVVHRVELTDRDAYGGESPPTVRLQLRATFTGDRTECGLGTGLVEVQSPAGSVGIETSAQTSGDRSGDFDPDVGQELTLAFAWPGAPNPAPERLRVLIRDERDNENYLVPTDWRTALRVDRHADLVLDDQRVDR